MEGHFETTPGAEKGSTTATKALFELHDDQRPKSQSTASESMDFEDFTMAEKLTTLQQIKKVDEERAKLLESAKADALNTRRGGGQRIDCPRFGPPRGHTLSLRLLHNVGLNN
jgi:hypothetical protein